MFKAVIFDRDGVIIDSEAMNIGAGEAAFRDLGIKITDHDKKQIIAKHPKDYIAHFKKHYTFSDEKFHELSGKHYYLLTEKTPLFPLTLDLIKRLHAQNIPLALTTSASRGHTDLILKRFNIAKFFNVIITEENCSDRKPHPEPYLLTAKKLGVDPKDCIVIEDSAIGLTAAKAAGMKCIVIPTEYTKDDDFSKADLIVEDASKITLDLLNSL